jgi:hypothetical protein
MAPQGDRAAQVDLKEWSRSNLGKISATSEACRMRWGMSGPRT